MTRRSPRPQVGFTVQHGSRELTAINTGLVGFAGLGVASSVLPIVEQAVTWLIAIAVAALAGIVARAVARRVRERRENRADTRRLAYRRAVGHPARPPGRYAEVGPHVGGER
jgi:uncharacterized membrane protein YuzA (DUF378 family)